MLGVFYGTELRDEYTGMTIFTFAPVEACRYVTDGLITCEGRIPPYKKGTPLWIDGNFQKSRYLVSNWRICQEGEKECQMLLNYVAPRYKGNIPASVEALILQGAGVLLAGGLNDLEAKKALKKINTLLETDKLYAYLSALGVAYDRIADILASEISIKDIKKDPYRHFLFRGIPISIADRIMEAEHHIHPYAPHRLLAYVRLAILCSENSGNSCISVKGLLHLTNHLLERSEMPHVHVNMALLNMCLMKIGEQVVWQDGYIYSKKAWQEETTLISHLSRLQKANKVYTHGDISAIEEKFGITYTEGQREVFRAIEKSGVKILTGPPGAGKSAVIQGITEAFPGTIRLCATTGRAAQVLSDYCKKPAETVHKLLDIRPFGENVSSKNINNPVEADLIVVDEFSMADLELASLLFNAIKTGSILLLVGDEDQLQSVGYGNILHDLIECGRCEVYRLKEVLRFDGDILENAKRIMQGNEKLLESNQFRIREFKDEDTLIEEVVANKGKEIQIISSIKKTVLGTFSLNQALQPAGREPCARYGAVAYFEGDKVIFTATNYNTGYWNGEIGTLMGHGKEEGSLEVQIGHRTVTVSRSDLHDLSLAYAITTHKCQGSGFDDILVILPDSAPNMLTRRLLYTAVTRARNSVMIYSLNNSLAYAVHNQAERMRTSILSKRIINSSSV